MIATLDLRGEVCPYTFVRTKLRLEELPLGAELIVIVDHPPAADNVPRALKGEGHQVISIEADGLAFRIRAVKRTQHRLETHIEVDGSFPAPHERGASPTLTLKRSEGES